MSQTDAGINLKLLAAVPAGARRVLELGCGDGRLGQRFKQAHPQTHWCGVDVSAAAIAAAKPRLDRVQKLDLDQPNLAAVLGKDGKGFDVIVIGDLLQHLKRPEALLNALHAASAENAQIVCCLPNMSHVSVIERLVAGDISYDASGLLDQNHLRFFSMASAFKTFLDCGWLPQLADQYRDEVAHTPFAVHLVEAAKALGIPRDTALRNLGMFQMVLVCRKWSRNFLKTRGTGVPFSVIVPVNRPWQYALNVASSPGLQEVGAEVIVVKGASSAAEAYATGCAQAKHAWRVLVHQDVYFPVGTGYALAQQLAALSAAGRVQAPVGFAGLDQRAESSPEGEPPEAGLVIDRDSLFDYGDSQAALSIDEFAVALHRDCAVAIDPALGWHFWGTDLCLQARQRAGRADVPVMRVPLYHNSTNDFSLPEAWHTSAERLLAKYPAMAEVPTLCGWLKRRTGTAPTALVQPTPAATQRAAFA